MIGIGDDHRGTLDHTRGAPPAARAAAAGSGAPGARARGTGREHGAFGVRVGREQAHPVPLLRRPRRSGPSGGASHAGPADGRSAGGRCRARGWWPISSTCSGTASRTGAEPMLRMLDVLRPLERAIAARTRIPSWAVVMQVGGGVALVVALIGFVWDVGWHADLGRD